MNKNLYPAPISQNIKSVFKAFAFYFLFTFVAFFSGEMMTTTAFGRNLHGFWDEELYCTVNFFYSLFAFFVFSELILKNNDTLKIAFAGYIEGGKKQCSPLKKFKFIFTCIGFWIEIAVFSLLSLIFNNTSLFRDLRNGFPKFSVCVLGMETPFLLAATFSLKALAYFTTISIWQQNPQKLRTDVATLTIVRKEQKASISDYIGFSIAPALKITLIAFFWGIGGSALSILIPMLVTFFTIINTAFLPVLIISAVFAMIVPFIYWLKGCFARKRVIKRIQVICSQKGYAFNYLGGIYFQKKTDEGYHFAIDTNEKIISCVFINVPKKKTALYINENGTASKEYQILFWKYVVTESYAFDCDDGVQKLLIVCPSSDKLFAKDEHSQMPINYGEKFLDYVIEDARGAIRYIDLLN